MSHADPQRKSTDPFELVLGTSAGDVEAKTNIIRLRVGQPGNRISLHIAYYPFRNFVHVYFTEGSAKALAEVMTTKGYQSVEKAIAEKMRPTQYEIIAGT